MTEPQKPLFKAPWLLRTVSFLIGLGILYHEVFLTPQSEPVLDLFAAYLLGVPITELLDRWRQGTR